MYTRIYSLIKLKFVYTRCIPRMQTDISLVCTVNYFQDEKANYFYDYDLLFSLSLRDQTTVVLLNHHHRHHHPFLSPQNVNGKIIL